LLYIDLPTRPELESLAAVRVNYCVSIYLKTTPLTQAAQADRIELKNLVKQAVSQLGQIEAAKSDIASLESAIDDLLADDGFWAHQANSLAVFATPERVRTYRLASRLESMVEVSDRFHVKPLLRAVTFPHDAYVLVLAEGGARLVEINAELPPHEVHVPGMPKDARKAGDHGRAQAGSYARAIDAALRPILSGHQRPLILAAAEPLASTFARVNSYSHLAEEKIGGNAERMGDQELATAARGVLDRIYAAEVAALGKRFAALAGEGRAITDLTQAARAATYGAIETLIVDMDAVVPGSVDEAGTVSRAEHPSASSYGVVDEITRRAMQSGARVVSGRSADVPGGGVLAAILRYRM